jgi:hypothetical protein
MINDCHGGVELFPLSSILYYDKISDRERKVENASASQVSGGDYKRIAEYARGTDA